jgi:hypothetical protein
MTARSSRCVHCPYCVDDLMSKGLRSLRLSRTSDTSVVVTAILDADPNAQITHVSGDAAEGIERVAAAMEASNGGH